MTFTGSYRDVTIGDLLTRLAADLPDREALVYPDRGIRWTFARLEQEATLVARGLLGLGVQKGDRVSIWATNVPEWVVLMFGLAKVGAVLVTVNTALGPREIEYLLAQSETSTLFLVDGFRDSSYVDIVKALDRTRVPHLREIVHIPRGERDAAPEGMRSYRELAERAAAVDDAALKRREASLRMTDVINMQYTSGTTGFPKGVMLSHRNIVNNASAIGDVLGYTPDDRLCLTVPFFHCFGCVIGVLGSYTHGAALIPLETFEPRRTLELIATERCTSIYGVPTMFVAELEHPDFDQFDLRSLRTGVMAGSLCPVELMKRAIQRMNLREMIIAYGLTEASPGVTATLRDDTLERRTSTVGRALPEVEVRIVDPVTLAELPRGEQGELVTRGYHVMQGYYRNEQATREAITPDGWLRSGDLAAMDSEGYVTITGRIKDMIIRGGENIYPKEIEELLRAHPAVSDVAVYGVPSRRYGEEVAAAVKLRSGATLREAELVEFCRTVMARFKVPRYIQFVDAFPLTASGKVQKFVLRARAATDFALADAAAGHDAPG